MSHDEGRAKATLLWCLKTGTDTGKDFTMWRNQMIAAAVGNNTKKLLESAQELLEDHDEDGYVNLVSSENEDPGGPLRWSRGILGI